VGFFRAYAKESKNEKTHLRTTLRGKIYITKAPFYSLQIARALAWERTPILGDERPATSSLSCNQSV
jgi:hypothetical protein